MTKVLDIINFTETFAPLNTQCEWDNSGLLVGNKDTEVKKVLLCLDITHAVVEEAKNLGCELIISHHPVIFSPLSHIDTHDVCYHLIRENIAALCLHTNLDRAQNIGVNVELAKALSLQNPTLYPEEFLCVGELTHEMNSDEFASFVKEALNCRGVRYTKKDKIKKVAVSSGGGGEAVFLKNKYDFDALVTGEIKHHLFLFASENELCAVEAGHFNTEDVVIAELVKNLAEKFPQLSFTKSVSLTDVVNFA